MKSGVRSLGLRFRVSGSKFRVCSSEFKVSSSETKAKRDTSTRLRWATPWQARRRPASLRYAVTGAESRFHSQASLLSSTSKQDIGNLFHFNLCSPACASLLPEATCINAQFVHRLEVAPGRSDAPQSNLDSGIGMTYSHTKRCGDAQVQSCHFS